MEAPNVLPLPLASRAPFSAIWGVATRTKKRSIGSVAGFYKLEGWTKGAYYLD